MPNVNEVLTESSRSKSYHSDRINKNIIEARSSEFLAYFGRSMS